MAKNTKTATKTKKVASKKLTVVVFGSESKDPDKNWYVMAGPPKLGAGMDATPKSELRLLTMMAGDSPKDVWEKLDKAIAKSFLKKSEKIYIVSKGF